MFKAVLFEDEEGQAVIIPPELAYADELQELNIERVGDVIVIYPTARNTRESQQDVPE